MTVALSSWFSTASLATTPASVTSPATLGSDTDIITSPEDAAATDLLASFPRVRDYTLLWWADGFQGRSPTGRWDRAIRTGQYAFVLDVDRMAVSHMGALGDAVPYAEAARQGNSAWSQLPPAQLDLEIRVDGITYRCIHGGPALDHDGPRIIESGRFFQRADVTGLVFESQEGETLPAESRFETCAWPDHLALHLEAYPTLCPISAADTFGRLGGGYGFDGTNHLDFPMTPEQLPPELTLACWVYIPADFCATRLEPWLLCANGNEWADGHLGIVLSSSGVPRAVLNIGGGRENCTFAAAAYADGRGKVLESERWHHLALTYDGATLNLFVNGQVSGTGTVNKARPPQAATLTFGRRGDNSGDGYHFRGVLDEVQVYHSALSAEAIAQLAGDPHATPAEPVVRDWSFNRSGTARDRRPTFDWANATLTLRLTTAEARFEKSLSQTADHLWTADEPGRVALALDFGNGAPRYGSPRGDTAEPVPNVVATDVHGGAAFPVVADPERGWLRVDLDGISKQGDDLDRIERVRLHLQNPSDQEQPVRLLFDKTRDLPITGMSAILRDAAGFPTGIPVQLSKNWHRSERRRLIYEGPWFHGFTFLRLPPHADIELELALIGARWGGVAAASHAQLCLVGWGSNQLWDQAAIGSWGENFCFEADRAQARALVCDVRPLMVHAMNSDLPTQWSWTNNVGGGDAFRLFANDGSYIRPVRMTTTYVRHGPCLTEVHYCGLLADGAIEHSLVTTLYRTDDMARCLYRLRFAVSRPVDFSRFVILQIGADTYGYTAERKMAVGNEQGLVREWATEWGGNRYRTPPALLAGRLPWVSLHEAVSRDLSKSGAWANRGLVIRSWQARLGGKDCGPWFAEHGVNTGGVDTSSADILPPEGIVRLEPGDFVDALIEHLVVPQFARDYYGPNETLRQALVRDANTWRMMHREAVGNDVEVTATTGHVEQLRPIVIRAEAGSAEFVVRGGKGYVPLTIRGLASFRAPRLEMRNDDGSWRAINHAVHGNDFWQTDFDPLSQTWDISFTFPADTPDDQRTERAFRFSVD
ncbi:MAG: LamG domain-containing protein [Pirellulaceae bacterium]